MTEFERAGGWPAVLGQIAEGQDLSRSTAVEVMGEILSGLATPAQIGGLLVGLRVKGESTDEMAGFVQAMLGASEPLKLPDTTIDIVGTGGSSHRRAHAMNVSTMACIVAAAAGAIVCKHGNRRASSTSGSFDFLEALGVAIDLTPSQLEECVDRIGLGFAFARTFHPAMRFAGPVRAELGIPTVFNVLGPLAHPGRLKRQLVGVASGDRARAMAEVLHQLGSVSSWVVAGADGIDELAVSGESQVFKVGPAGVTAETIRPSDYGIAPAPLTELVGGSAHDNVAIFEAILDGQSGPHRDIVVVNAAAGLAVAGVVGDFAHGLEAAAGVIDSGRVSRMLESLRTVTNELSRSG